MKANALTETVRKTIKTYLPALSGKKVLVGLSGGVDSVCLLHCLYQLKYEFSFTLSAAHVHHGLRGAEADRDETFAEEFCQKLDIPFYKERFDVLAYAKTNKLCVEDAGRQIRYNYFEKLKKEYHFDYVATAHHSDDNTETVLMRFLRGSGIHGLAGIPVCDKRNIIRPLLFVNKQDILSYAEEYQLSYVTDSSNESCEYLRNQIRNSLIPQIEGLNPGFKRSLAQNIRLYQEADAFLLEITAKTFERIASVRKDYIILKKNDWEKEHSAIRHLLLKEAIFRLANGFLPDGEKIYSAEEHIFSKCGIFEVGRGVMITVCNHNIYVYKDSNPDAVCSPVVMDTPLVLPNGTLIVKKVTKRKEKNNNLIYLDADKVKDLTLSVRCRKDGDYFYPLGFNHKKSLQDYFVDHKIPRFLRDRIPLLVCGDDIIWVCGHRQDARYHTESSNHLLEVTYTEDE
ncbi:MAG: tRNA lysidine(34) synthetase TilS [Clostridia bacterium]|nr:tRNA lysidine(34) synthetase TilS [Clostridia bacterium]